MNNLLFARKSILIIVFLLYSFIKLHADEGEWTIVRKATWTFSMTRVIFLDNQRGFIKGNHDELLVTENGGETWSLYPWPDSIITTIAGFWNDMELSPNKDIWLAAEEGALVRIPYDTSSWEFHVLPNQPLLRSVSFIDTSKGWIAGYYGEIFQSTNGAVTWQEIYNFQTILWDICFLDSLQGFVLVRTGEDQSRGYKTEDGGHTWTIISNPDVHGRKMYFLDQKHGWIVGEYHDLFLTTDGGETWKAVTANSGNERQHGVYFLTPRRGWISGENGLLMHTEDGGHTWNRMNSPCHFNTIYDVFFINENHGWAVTQWGIIAVTHDGGHSWEWQVDAPNNHLFSVFFKDEYNGFAIGHNIFAYTKDAGATWQQTDSLSGHDVLFVDNDYGWLSSKNHLYHTDDGGNSWYRQVTFNEKNIGNICFVDHLHGWVLFITAEKSTIYGTQDGGNTWEKLSELPYDLYEMEFITPTHGWIVGGEERILHTQDGGLSWELQHEEQSVSLDALLDVDFVDHEFGWAVGFKGQIWHTKDGGKNWVQQRRTNYLDDQYYGVHFLNRSEGWVVGLVGIILHTTDGGQTWDDSYSEYMGYWWHDVYFTDPDHGWAVGLYGAVNKFLGPNALSVQPAFEGKPEGFSLISSYPNPMRNRTNIIYEVPYKAPVQVEIYDILGRKVRNLEQSVKRAGRYTVSWDGRDNDGLLVPSGIYFYHLKAGKIIKTKKLVLIR